MAKGLSKRRRVKRALDAARGNLHKIANGKALPVALPEAPKSQDVEKLPASLRKMMALKEAAQQQDSKASTGGRQGKNGDSTESQGGDGPSTSGRTGKTDAKQQPTRKGGEVVGGNAFTAQFTEKKLKDKKKDYLKRKQEKKRNKGAAGELVVEKELQLRDKVKFGEVVDAPLEVHLKRKHWVDKEKTANERCKEIFLKQMQQAQQRMAGGTTDEGIAVRGSKPGAPGPSQQQRSKKRKAPADEETEALRLQVIESYRAAKKGGGFHNAAVGNATMHSLSRLVGKAPSTTHTLA